MKFVKYQFFLNLSKIYKKNYFFLITDLYILILSEFSQNISNDTKILVVF